MQVFALFVFPDFKNHGLHSAPNPADRAILLWHIRSPILVVGMREYFPNFLKADPPLWVRPQFLAFPGIETQSHVV